jgi:hypothetical protein
MDCAQKMNNYIKMAVVLCFGLQPEGFSESLRFGIRGPRSGGLDCQQAKGNRHLKGRHINDFEIVIDKNGAVKVIFNSSIDTIGEWGNGDGG